MRLPTKAKMRGPTDGSLLGQAMDGDKAGFLRLVDRYAPLVAAVVQHHLGIESAAAQRVVAETFREAFLEMRRFSDPESFYRELLIIARRRSRAELPVAAQTKGNEEIRHGDPHRELENPQTLAKVVRWKYLEGLSYEEISQRLGIAVESVDALIQHGRIQSRWSHWAPEEIS